MPPSASPESSTVDLRDLQRRFHTAVLGADDDPVLPLVEAAHGSIAARIAVYRHTVQASLIDVLATGFPVTRRVVGVPFFTQLARGFVTTEPPTVPQLSVYGAGFSAFVARHDVGQRLPYLADVARLEWARSEVYFAADAKPLDAARLAARPATEVERLVLRLHPATRLVTSAFPIFRIWEVNQPDVVEVPCVDMTPGQSVLVSRAGHRLVTRALAPADAALMSAVSAGRTLVDAASVALEVDAAFDLQSALQRHFIDGAFREDGEARSAGG